MNTVTGMTINHISILGRNHIGSINLNKNKKLFENTGNPLPIWVMTWKSSDMTLQPGKETTGM